MSIFVLQKSVVFIHATLRAGQHSGVQIHAPNMQSPR
jgi:hypothetical protein